MPLPSLPPRATKPGPSAQSADGVGQTDTAALADRAAQLAGNPGVQRLLQNPELLQQAIESNPALKAVAQQSGSLSTLTNPERLGQVLALAQGGAGPLNGAHGAPAHLARMEEGMQRLQMLQLMMASPPSGGQPQWPSGAGVGTTPPQGSSGTSSSSSTVPLRPPHQAVSFYGEGRQQQDGGGEQGSFSYSHTEREVPIHDLPLELQRQLVAAHGGSGACCEGHGHSHNHGSNSSSVAANSYSHDHAQHHHHYHRSAEIEVAGDHVAQLPVSYGTGGHNAGAHGSSSSSSKPMMASSAPGPGGSGAASSGPAAPQAVALDPRTHYEAVAPSHWRPEQPDTYLQAYRRAYCTETELLFFPLFFLACTAVLQLPPPLAVPFHWLLALVAVLLVLSSCMVGYIKAPKYGRHKEMANNKAFFSFIITIELAYPYVYCRHILPYWHGATSIASLVLLMAFAAMPVLHAVASLSDPGFVKAPGKGDSQQEDPAELEEEARQLASALAPFVVDRSGDGSDAASSAVVHHHQNGDAGAACAHGSAAAPSSVSSTKEGGQQKQHYGGGGGGDVEHGKATAGALLQTKPWCTTCALARPLRSKHCPACARCVGRMDHHCPAIANCVGEGNERAFTAWLVAILTAQLLFIRAGSSYILQAYLVASGQAAATSAPDMGPAAMARAFWWAQDGARGLLLLVMLQVVCVLPGTLLALRQVAAVAANLTSNEIINRDRYPYLNHGFVTLPDGIRGGQYCNRFDRGVVRNCLQFWAERPPPSYKPGRDPWRHLYDRAEEEMSSRGIRKLSEWSLTPLIWWRDGCLMSWDVKEKKMKSALLDVRAQRGMRGMEVRAQAAAAAAAAAARAE